MVDVRREGLKFLVSVLNTIGGTETLAQFKDFVSTKIGKSKSDPTPSIKKPPTKSLMSGE